MWAKLVANFPAFRPGTRLDKKIVKIKIVENRVPKPITYIQFSEVTVVKDARPESV